MECQAGGRLRCMVHVVKGQTENLLGKEDSEALHILRINRMGRAPFEPDDPRIGTSCADLDDPRLAQVVWRTQVNRLVGEKKVESGETVRVSGEET